MIWIEAEDIILIQRGIKQATRGAGPFPVGY